DYHFIDGGALSIGAKTIYYRLQMVDNDGKSAYSKIADVELLPGNNFFAAYPNPVKDKLVIVTNNAVNAATIKVTDQAGKIIILQQLENIQAGAKNTINVSALGNGIYYMQIISGNNKQTIRFVKY
ncbi:MAG TPA: T9SS type A sorting domain-containing protein, partial [Parafilimonas sp.]